MMVNRKVWLSLLSCLLVFMGITAQASDRIAIQAGRIIPVDGEEILDGVILIEGGKIRALGRDLEIPYDYWLIDASDKTVFPGMVESMTSRGLDQGNETQPVTPFLDVYDAIDPSSYFFEDALRDGVTTLLISQGTNTVISGLARAVKPIGMTVEAMTVQPEAGILLAFAPKGGSDRMIQMALFRETFRELEVYLEDLAEARYEEKLKDEGKEIDKTPEEARELGRSLIRDEDLDFKHLNLVRLKRAELRPYLYCARPVDVMHALDMAREHGFLEGAVLVLESACYKAVDLIKASGCPVILDTGMIFREIDPLTGEEEEIFFPTLLHEAGVPFAVRSQPGGAFGARYLWYQAARLVRNGIPRQTALEAITLIPARTMGLQERLGALKPELDANLLVLSGDPLDGQTWVEKVFIEGNLVYEKEKDYRLQELMTSEEASPEEPGVDDEEPSEGEG